MNTELMLYARSARKDYRWMFAPQTAQPQDLSLLKDLFDAFDDRDSVSKTAEVSPTFCLHFAQFSTLVEWKKTGFTDEHNRDIYCLQGIAISARYRRLFWFLLPWLLTSHRDTMLNIWSSVDFNTADKYYDTPKSRLVELAEFSDRLSEGVEYAPQNPIKDRIQLPFNSTGYNQLVRIVSNQYSPLPNFAFGTTPEALSNYPHFSIVSFVQLPQRSGRRPPPLYRENNPAQVSNQPQIQPSKRLSEPPQSKAQSASSDPFERFNPLTANQSRSQQMRARALDSEPRPKQSQSGIERLAKFPFQIIKQVLDVVNPLADDDRKSEDYSANPEDDNPDSEPNTR